MLISETVLGSAINSMRSRHHTCLKETPLAFPETRHSRARLQGPKNPGKHPTVCKNSSANPRHLGPSPAPSRAKSIRSFIQRPSSGLLFVCVKSNLSPPPPHAHPSQQHQNSGLEWKPLHPRSICKIISQATGFTTFLKALLKHKYHFCWFG